ncbi:guanine nucleotide-binding protein subunit gamma 3-like isoform X2 [Mercurialis annua]|uniref:guanine nucleotide-binding protein subunit gamma 3-like isoform X2 n=1 Tax=Mercurialis annua TaxID=3986 RepID=UPI00216058CC|nr:guanine nucleotide-binding protein subunit gamma 3-like isoform X2 [Mercurialis annua]
MDGFSNSCSSSCLSAVCPKSPPGGLDLFGKRRQLVKVQILEREIGLLQEELKSVEGLQPASRSCKELNDFVGAKPDPLVSIGNEEAHKSHLCWKKLCCSEKPSCTGLSWPTCRCCLNSSLCSCKKLNHCCSCSNTCCCL